MSLHLFITDVRELEKGMELTKRELENRLKVVPNATTTVEQQRIKQDQNQALQNFVDKASDLVIKLRTDTNNAQAAFKDCAEYFGEDSKVMDCNTFFGYFVRFTAIWKTHVEENVKRRKIQEQTLALMKNPPPVQSKKPSQEKMKNAVINELKTRNTGNHLFKFNPNEVQDGTFEKIIMDMKDQPFRTKGSFRKPARHEGMAISSQETDLV